MRLDDFLDALAARTPAPGGGGLPGALEAAEQADDLRRRAAALAEADAAAYTAVLDARRQGGDLRQALYGAAVVPLEIAEIGAQVAELALRVAEAGTPTLRGDAVTGALLAAASARSAACLVNINVAWGELDPDLIRRAAQAAGEAGDAAMRATMMTERRDPEPR